jgi:biopolymer transport protein ExbD
MARTRGYRKLIEADLDIMPLMNLFVVLIPMLLLSAVFVELSAIDMQSPSSAEAKKKDGPPLDLALEIRPSHYNVTGRGLERRRVARGAEDSSENLRILLRGIVERHPGESELRIKSPSDTEYQELITAMDISRSVGLSAISLMGNGEAANDATREAR